MSKKEINILSFLLTCLVGILLFIGINKAYGEEVYDKEETIIKVQDNELENIEQNMRLDEIQYGIKEENDGNN